MAQQQLLFTEAARERLTKTSQIIIDKFLHKYDVPPQPTRDFNIDDALAMCLDADSLQLLSVQYEVNFDV